MEVLAKAAVLVAMIGVGYGAKRLRWVAASDFNLLSRILLRITLPCALATSFDSFDLQPDLLYLAGLGMAVVGSQAVAGAVLSRARGRRGQAFSALNVSSFNIGLFAVPYVMALLGHQAVVYAALFDIGNALIAAGLLYAWAMGAASGAAVTPGVLLRKLFSSIVFDVYLVLLALSLLHLKLPSGVIAFTTLVGNANTFLAMFTIGVGLEVALARGKVARALKHLALRYALSLLWLPVVLLLPIGADVKAVVAVLLFAPLAAMIAPFTAEGGLDVETSAYITSLSVLVAIVALPLVALALT